MILADVRLYQYRLPLCKPLALKSHRIFAREGLIVRLSDQHAHIGWGEIAPLPGFSVETLDDACVGAIGCFGSLRKVGLPEPEPVLERGICAYLKIDLPASVACGIESAILNLWADCRGEELRHLINPEAPDFILVNGLLTGSETEVLDRAHHLISNGYKTLKLKVGAESLETDIAKVRALRKTAPDCRFRLDANRAWDFDTAVQFGQEVRVLNIEYIEEPLADSSALGEFYDKSGLLYAIDESLVGTLPSELEKHNGLRAVILKPTLIGGISTSLKFARRAKQLGLLPVFSSAFESSLGLHTLANLASAVAANTAGGLDTASWLDDDLLARPIVTAAGTLKLGENYRTDLSVRMELLTEIPVPR